eukprot:TRINITY_DN106590_c0_g1_i1.p1 TRINITY_DN106590_c0_g1~~TRINITY_DN106590_c0_g1_i1.p1  ORF type:complete len:428 (+),score=66.25 TRINITY_DN106590_c0_g1_i1:115-1398(+)
MLARSLLLLGISSAKSEPGIVISRELTDAQPVDLQEMLLGGLGGGMMLQGMPIVVNMGPLMDSDDLDLIPRRRGPSGFDQFEQMHQALLGGLLQDFGGHLNHAVTSGSGGFQTEVKNDHFLLRAILPGYKMHTSGDGSDPSQPLSVQVLGRSLVVKGQQTHGAQMASFQRSFALPFEPDADKVSVTYKALDGSLAVDVPKKEGAASMPEDNQLQVISDENPLAALFPGSQMTIAFSGSPGGRPQPQPLTFLRGRRGGLNSLINDLFSDAGADISGDPFEDLWSSLERRGSIVERRSAGDAKNNLPAPGGQTTKSPARAKTPVVVQPKSAQPFWRLAGSDKSGQSIDIVAPSGLEMGAPDGNIVQFTKTEANTGSTGTAPIAGKLQLPVSVKGEDCQSAGTNSQEHILRCHIRDDSVKNVPIRVLDEL